MVSVGSATVALVPDATGFQAKTDALLRNIQATVDLVLKDTGVREQIDELTKGRTATIGANVDTSAATAKLDALAQARRSATVSVDLDSRAATAELDAYESKYGKVNVHADLDDSAAVAEFDELTRTRSVTVNADANTGEADSKLAALGSSAGGAGGQVSALVAAGAAIAPAIVPAAAAAAGALAGISSGAIAGAAGIGVLVLGFAGVISAVSDVQKAQASAAASAAADAAKQVAAAQRIQSAEAGVKSAEAALANTRANAADAARRAAQAVQQAQDGVRTATQQAAQGVTQALGQERTAEQSLQQALQQETDAQHALSDARKQAKQDLQDLTNSVADGALAQRQAAIDVENAKSALASLGPTQVQIEQATAKTALAQQKYNALLANPKGTQAQKDAAKAALDAATAQQQALESQVGGSSVQRQQAQLDYDQAIQHQKELALQQQRLVQQQKAAQAAGISGAPGVVSAQQNLTQAQQGVANARRSVSDAQKAVTAARVAGVAQINKAEQALAQAEQARASQERQSEYSIMQAQQQVVNSQRSLQDAYTKTGKTASAAGTTAQQALAKLTPEGRKLVDFITGTLIPGFHEFSNIAQRPLATGALAGLEAMKPDVPVIKGLIDILAKSIGGLLDSAGKALGSPFWVTFFGMIKSIAGPTVKELGTIIGNIVTGFAGMMTVFAPIGLQILGWLDQMSGKFKNFGTGKTTGLGQFFDYVQQVGPLVAGTLGSLFSAAGHIIAAFAPFGTTVLGWIKGFADWISRIPTKTLQDIGKYALEAFGAFKILGTAGSLLGGLTGAIEFLSNPVGLVAAAVALLAAGFIIAYQHIKTFRDYVNDKVVPILKGIWHDAMIGVKDAIGQITKAIQDNKPELELLWAGFKKVADFVVTKVLPLLGPILKATFQNMGDQIAFGIDTVGFLVDAFVDCYKQTQHSVQVIADAVRGLLGRGGTLRTLFSEGVTELGKIWKGLEALAKAPISFMINTVLDKGLIPAYNWVAGVLPGVKKINPVKIAGFADGGIMPGYTPGRDVHRFYSPTGGTLELSGGEPVLRPEAGRVLGSGWVNGVNAAARSGGVGGVQQFLGMGGRQALAQGGSIALRSMGGSASNFLGDALGSIGESYPIGYCLAFVTNLAGSGIRPGIYDAISAWRDSGKKHPGEIPSGPAPVFWGGGSAGHGHVAAYVGNGKIVSTDAPVPGRVGEVPLGWIGQHWGLPYLGWTGVGNSSGPYTGNSGGLLGSVIDYASQLKEKLVAPLNELKSVAGTPWGQMVAAAPKSLATSMIDSAKNFATGLLGDVSGAVSEGTNQAKALAMLTAAGFNPITQWSPLNKLWTRESGFRVNATNPTSGAYGIPQALPAAKMASAGPDWQTSAATQIKWGLQYIKDTYGTPAAAWAHELASGWYDQGGWLQPGTTIVHNDTGRPEAVLSPSQWAAFTAAANRPPVQFTLDVHDNDIKDEKKLVRQVMTSFEDAMTLHGMTVGAFA